MGRSVRFGLYIAPFGALADVAALARIALTAERAGWDGVFLWDHVMAGPDVEVADPWVALTAVALATERLRLGPMVTPLARRRPWDVARAAATLDRLSGGRVTLGVGLGGDRYRELSAFGEEVEDRARGGQLDEALDQLLAFWSGQPLTHAGPRHVLDGAQVLPTPLQQPRIPVWAACVWPNRAPLRRAARLDGVFPVSHDRSLDGEDVLAIRAITRDLGARDPFDVVITNGERPSSARLDELSSAGATWWLQSFGDRPTMVDVEAAASAGPPQ